MVKTDVKKTTEELFRDYKETKSPETRNKIVEENLYIAQVLANKYAGRGVDYEDLYQVASYALLLAVTRYDPDKSIQFMSYATPTVIGEIKKYFRDAMWPVKVPRRLKEIAGRILEAREYLQETNGRIPTTKELARHLEISQDDVIEALESSRVFTIYSLDRDAGEISDEIPAFEKYLGEEEKGYEKLETSGVLEKVIAGLSSKEKEVIRKRILQEITQKQVAESLGISQMTVSRIEKNLKEKFRRELYQ